MAALLDDRAVLHHQNHIGAANSRQPVGHNEAGSALHHRIKGLLDPDFRTADEGEMKLLKQEKNINFV